MCRRMEQQSGNTLQVDLAEAERSREALWEKNTRLEAQLQKTEETRAELQPDLRGIQEEKEEMQEKLAGEDKTATISREYIIHAHCKKNENTTETSGRGKSHFLEMTSIIIIVWGTSSSFLKKS